MIAFVIHFEVSAPPREILDPPLKFKCCNVINVISKEKHSFKGELFNNHESSKKTKTGLLVAPQKDCNIP